MNADKHRYRVVFIDLARALAVILMVSGHTSSALLAPVHQSGPWFDVWVFQRGLTSGLFLLLSGFAFSVATMRHWATHLHVSHAVGRRAGRFLLFVVLGYALHIPVRPVSAVAAVTDREWQSFIAVDVLQLIGVTLFALQALVLIVRTRWAFAAATFLLAIGIATSAPAVWRVDWVRILPAPIAAYLTPATGSQFPLVPWAVYVLIGAGLGQLYARWGASHLAAFANWSLLAPGLVLPVAGITVFSGLPGEVAIRTGACLVVLGLIAHASRYIAQLPHVFGAVAQESLVVYFVHLCVVYGSVWNDGVDRFYGGTLTVAQTGLVALAVVSAMVALAWHWNRLKHARPHAARWIWVGTSAALVVRLL